ncbi:MAG: hypothetical protein AABX34_02015 [Nanoarchaeota archaeon]
MNSRDLNDYIKRHLTYNHEKHVDEIDLRLRLINLLFSGPKLPQVNSMGINSGGYAIGVIYSNRPPRENYAHLVFGHTTIREKPASSENWFKMEELRIDDILNRYTPSCGLDPDIPRERLELLYYLSYYITN